MWAAQKDKELSVWLLWFSCCKHVRPCQTVAPFWTTDLNPSKCPKSSRHSVWTDEGHISRIYLHGSRQTDRQTVTSRSHTDPHPSQSVTLHLTHSRHKHAVTHTNTLWHWHINTHWQTHTLGRLPLNTPPGLSFIPMLRLCVCQSEHLQ